MRWVSLCAVLGVALLSPAADARPCKTRSTTTPSATHSPTLPVSSISSVSTPISTPASSDISTPISTPVSSDVSTPISTPVSSDVSVSLSTPVSTDLSTPVDSTTTPTSVSSTPSVSETPSSTPTPTSTPTPEPTPVNLIQNGNFEGEDVSVWAVRTVSIEEDAAKAASGSHYARFYLDNDYGTGGNHLNQTINGLDTSRLYRLSFSGAAFGLTNLGDATCEIQALANGEQKGAWPIRTIPAGSYSSYGTDFIADSEDFVLTFRVRCSGENLVTLDFAVDDIVLQDIGAAPVSPI
ncbi:hypothetical protein V2G26_011243 [Clonostachys chloroleuca]|uniref:CBM-cenC domain-containing protein n=1 Tax=Clonostachys chloroleuca TaxID=1926264 RepID=A0AA35LT35_9HYPO|nr:unnamed protein product [Clonostachys chloroleuca]